MDQPAQQEKLFQAAHDRPRVSKPKRTLLIALIVGIILVINLLTFLQYHDAKLAVSQVEKPAAGQIIIAQDIAPPEQTRSSLLRSPAETSRDDLFQKGMYALINKQFQEAINSFAELQVSNPEMLDKIDLPYAEALLGLADTLRKSDPQQAITLFKKAIQLDPRSVRAHFHLGMILTSQKDYAGAIKSYQRAIELKPQLPDIFFNLGFLYAASKNYAGAEEMYTKTVALQPDYLDEALFNLALAQSKLDKKEQSLANLKKALSVNPENQAAQNYLAQLQGDSEE
jgi:tetratricopeptide (TPR) repeat protein